MWNLFHSDLKGDKKLFLFSSYAQRMSSFQFFRIRNSLVRVRDFVFKFSFSNGVSHLFGLVFQFAFSLDSADGSLVVTFIEGPNTFVDLGTKTCKSWTINFLVFICVCRHFVVGWFFYLGDGERRDPQLNYLVGCDFESLRGSYWS